MHRRQILKAIPAMWLASPAVVKAKTPDQEIDEAVASLLARLAALHGGNWTATQDKKHEFVMICRS